MARDLVDIATATAEEKVAGGVCESYDDSQANSSMNGPSSSTTPHANGANGVDTDSKPRSWIPIAEHSLWEPQRKVKVISIGCGFSGLTMAHKIQDVYKMDDRIEHIMYEKNPMVGGTWYENRYPGVMCDVPAHIYTLLDLPNPDWPSFYATGAEIQAYLLKITKQYNLDRDVICNSTVTSAIWSDATSKWTVTVQQGDRTFEDTCDVLINGSGVLNAWSWPPIPGLHSFKGRLCHSADWDSSYDFSGKRIAVIGNGSSAIQIVPELAKVAASLTNIVRHPTWISAPFAEDLSKEPGANPQYSDAEKATFRREPETLKKHRHDLAHAFNHFYEALIEGSDANREARRRTEELMRQRLAGRPDLADKLIPKWSLGCRRLTPGNGYLEALCRENVELVVGEIEEVTATGVRMRDGMEREFDAIVCATGFDVSFKPRWRQVGRLGRDLAEEWKEDSKSYFSLCVSGQPNYFIFNGPAGPVGHGSLSSAIDWAAEYILKWLDKMAREDIKSFDVKQDVQDEWNVWGDELMKRTVWQSDCRSWYKNDRTGRISALYPGSILHFKDLIENIRGEDFDIRYSSKNRWKFCGDGFTKLEKENGDLAYYLTC